MKGIWAGITCVVVVMLFSLVGVVSTQNLEPFSLYVYYDEMVDSLAAVDARMGEMSGDSLAAAEAYTDAKGDTLREEILEESQARVTADSLVSLALVDSLTAEYARQIAEHGERTTADSLIKKQVALDSTAVAGLGTMAAQNANGVAITGGSAIGLTAVDTDSLKGNTVATDTLTVNGSFNAGNGDFYVNGVTGNVGIGTVGPKTKLQVAGDYTTIDGLGFIASFTPTGGYARFGWWNPASPNTKFAFGSGYGDATRMGFLIKTSGDFSASSEKMTILNNGNVGIGTTAPQATLQLFKANTDTTKYLFIAGKTSGQKAAVDTLGNLTLAGTINGQIQVVTTAGNVKYTAAQSGSYRSIYQQAALRADTLCAAAVGVYFDFFVSDTDSLVICAAAGDTLLDGVTKNTRTSTVAGVCRMTAITTDIWALSQKQGTWTGYDN
uniref:Uncharacterized protein n=2 Tax=viral metagenome TaxID=1070528 RepID=A0A6M3KYN5_9ZZZZ